MRFRMRHNGEHSGAAPAAPIPAANGADASASHPAPPAVAQPGPLSLRFNQGPLKSQMSASDVRTDRVARQIRAEIDGLRASVALFQATPGDFTRIDPAAVAADPDAAAALPPALLVAAIVEADRQQQRFAARLAKQRARIEKLEARVRELKQERAWLRGRQQTLDEVIGALHANIEDLRLHRDALPAPDRTQRALHQPGHGLLDEGGCEALA